MFIKECDNTKLSFGELDAIIEFLYVSKFIVYVYICIYICVSVFMIISKYFYFLYLHMVLYVRIINQSHSDKPTRQKQCLDLFSLDLLNSVAGIMSREQNNTI